MSQNQRSWEWAMGLHLSALIGYVAPIPFAGILAPILIWQLARRHHPDIDPHGRNAVNWMISSTLYSTLAVLSVVGILTLPILAGLGIVFPIIAASKASMGEVWSYPLTINFVGNRLEKPLRRISFGLLSLCILPLVGVMGSSYWVNHRSQWLSRLSQTQGAVLEVREKTDDEGDTVYQPVVQFQDASGESYQVSSTWWSSSPVYQKGESVNVLYPLKQPKKALIDDWAEKWLFCVGALILCGIWLIFSLIPSLLSFIFSFWI